MALSDVDLKTTYMQIQHYGLSSKLNCIIGLQICIIRIHYNINSMNSEEEEEEEKEEEEEEDGDDDDGDEAVKTNYSRLYEFSMEILFLFDTSNHTGSFM